jgi:hypothetical protein
MLNSYPKKPMALLLASSDEKLGFGIEHWSDLTQEKEEAAYL